MCKQLCEQTEEGKRLWEHWRTTHTGWRQAADYHREMVLAAMREDAKRGGSIYMHLDYRDGTSETIIQEPTKD